MASPPATPSRVPAPIPDDEPVTAWLEGLRNGEQSAARKIWHHFVHRLYEAARKRLHPTTRRVYDEHDAAQSAFHSLCAGIGAGRFPDLQDRDSLWRLLLVITSRKVSHRHRYDRQAQRDVRRLSGEAAVFTPGNRSESLVDQLPSREPTPEFAAEFVETCGSLFEGLDDLVLRKIGWLKVEGYKDDEVAQQMNCSRRTVQRKIELIRRSWSDQQENK